MSISAQLAASQLQMPHTSKSVLMWYALRSKDDLTAWPSQADTMTGTCLSESSVRRAIDELCRLGHLSTTGAKRGHTAVYRLAYMGSATGQADRFAVEYEPVTQTDEPVTQTDEPVTQTDEPVSLTPGRERNVGKKEEGTQTHSPHLIITEKTEREKIMDTLTKAGAVTNADTIAQWEEVTEGLTAAQVAGIMAAAEKRIKWPSEFAKARVAVLVSNPRALLTAAEIEAQSHAKAARHAALLTHWRDKWARLEIERREKYGDAWWDKNHKGLARAVPSEVRQDVTGVA